MPLVRTDGLSVGVRSRDYQIFSDGRITSFSYPWCSDMRALRARAPLWKLIMFNSVQALGFFEAMQTLNNQRQSNWIDR